MSSGRRLAPSNATVPGPSQARGTQTYRRDVAASACDYCRKKKTGCSGVHPCAKCVKDGKECRFSRQRPGESLADAQKRITREKDQQINSLTRANDRLEAENEELKRRLRQLGQSEDPSQGSETNSDPSVSGKGKGKRRADYDDDGMNFQSQRQRSESLSSSNDAPCHDQTHRDFQTQIGILRQTINDKDRDLGFARGKVRYLEPYEKNIEILREADQFVGEEMLWKLQTTPSIKYNWGTPIGSSISHKVPAPRRYDFPYKLKMPGYLRIPSNVYLKSRLWKALESDDINDITKYDSVYTKPFHEADLDEDRLKDAYGKDINISSWTRVRCNNKLCLELLKAYFMYEHVEYPFVHKDLFLEDLREDRQQFCSEVLVNAVLAAACHCLIKIPNRHSMFKDPHSLGYKFEAEAQRLLDRDIENFHLTNLQAAYIMDVLKGIQARGMIGRAYRELHIREWQEIAQQKALIDPREQQAFNFLDWWGFGWISMSCFYTNRIPPRIEPPESELPHPKTNRAWYGETHVVYPKDYARTPNRLPECTWARLRLHWIFNNITTATWTEGAAPVGRLTLAEANGFYKQLEQWFDELPREIDAENLARPNELRLHMEYHYAILRLFEPHIECSTKARTIVTETRALMETVARLYYARHSFTSHDSLLLPLLAFLDGQVQRAGYAHDDMLAARFICANGIYHRAQSFNLASVYYGHWRQLRWTPEDWVLCCREAKLDGDEKLVASIDLSPTGCRSEWWDPSIGPDDDHTQWTMNELARRYRERPYEARRTESQLVSRPRLGSPSNSGGWRILP